MPTATPPSPTPSPAAATLPAYRASGGAFVRAANDGLQINGKRFTVRGITLPRDLWAEDALLALETDFAHLQQMGANTVRLPLRHAALFANGAPVPEGFARLDAVLRLAAAYNLHVIPVLYTDVPSHALPNTSTVTVLATRYRDEPALLMWDLRDVATDTLYAQTSRDKALFWLAQTAAAMHAADPVHPLTTTWRGDPIGTLASVDVVAVQFSGSVEDLRREVAALRQLCTKPVLLSAFCENDMEALHAVVRAAEGDRLAGWLLSTTDRPADPFETLDALLNP